MENENELKARVADIIEQYREHGELTDGGALDCVYELMGFDDIDECEKIWCINELLETIKGR